MNVLNLSHALDITSVAGQTLSAEEEYVVKNALLVLQGENHFKDIYFLGKIFGIEKDYYIAFGYGSDAIGGRSFFYRYVCVLIEARLLSDTGDGSFTYCVCSTNQCDWFVLSEPSPCASKLSPRVSQRFTGDPSHVVDWRDAGDAFGISVSILEQIHIFFPSATNF